ncbi:translation protein [Paraphysoderma sedebokerense]|nr:translation protein [Paraphysoderma sedebokerense]
MLRSITSFTPSISHFSRLINSSISIAIHTSRKTISTSSTSSQAATVPSASNENPSKLIPGSPATPADYTPTSRRTGVIAIKKGMSALWDEWGVRIPVTILQLDNVKVVQAKTKETDGYTSLQLGSGVRKPHRAGATVVGHCAKFGVETKAKLGEFRVTEDALLPPGTEIRASHFVPGQYVDVTAPSVGKGFQGVMKRWGFKGQPATHGVSIVHRSLGSTGQCQDPGRVFKNKKMPGRMGGKPITTQNLLVYKVDTEANVIYVKGAVPGHDSQFVRVQDSLKKWQRGKLFPEGTTVPFPTDLNASTEGKEIIMPKSGSDPWLKYEQV